MKMENFIYPLDLKFEGATENIFRTNRPEIDYTFDYEINKIYIETDENNNPKLYDKITKKLLNINEIKDKISISPDGPSINETKTICCPKISNLIKHIVSKKKHRIYNDLFDLDLSYITEHTVAMGFPSIGIESIYRNSLNDIINFLNKYHSNYKIYNLCLEENKIYNKEFFIGKELAIFPFIDHEPCPIKLILEFCIDIVLYLNRNPDGLCAIHCKAGKGRTGVMIVCYMIFTGICNNSQEALDIFAQKRTVDSKGVTIPSQIRYIEYFESFLSMNFSKPYYKNIPKIIQCYIANNSDMKNFYLKNILYNYIYDNEYFYTPNFFQLKSLTIGPFISSRDYDVKLSSIVKSKLIFPNAIRQFERNEYDNKYYYNIIFNSNDDINYDIKLQVSCFKFSFYTWVNLWYNTIENLSKYILGKDIINKCNNIVLDNSKNYSNNTLQRKSNSSIIEVIKQIEEISTSINETKTKNHNIGNFSSNNEIARLIYNFSNEKDLNSFISGINEISEKNNIELFNPENQKIKIDLNELDKFNDWFGSVDQTFCIQYTYRLLPKFQNNNI